MSQKSERPCFGAHNPTEVMGCPEWCSDFKECLKAYEATKQKIENRDRASGYGKKYSRMQRLPRWTKL